MIIFSAHSDTNFKSVKLKIDGDDYVGYLDNYVGVYSLIKAYFSGEIGYDYVRTEFTYGEETDFGGAIEVAKEINKDDLVIVIDVTATPTDKDFVIEKCKSPKVKAFVWRALYLCLTMICMKIAPIPFQIWMKWKFIKRKLIITFSLAFPAAAATIMRTK